MTVAIEDAGFEIRDCLSWLYGSGFPKSLNVSKAIDKAAGALTTQSQGFVAAGHDGRKAEMKQDHSFRADYGYEYKPATPEAKQWDGWGTALKPAWEPICLARKPLAAKTVATNVLEHGTGSLNINGCRIQYNEPIRVLKAQPGGDKVYGQDGRHEDTTELKESGRWPANVILDESVAAQLDAMIGERKSGKPSGNRNAATGFSTGITPGAYALTGYGDSGGVSRFYYTAKASSAERSAGLDSPNTHPTVKPISLMRYLVRLITPPGGIVLDPFMGSGTTGIAAALEQMQFEGRDLSPEYVEIARKRIAHWSASLQPELL
jgi:site-specific DNA-methyltransferase (adenine-specific)